MEDKYFVAEASVKYVLLDLGMLYLLAEAHGYPHGKSLRLELPENTLSCAVVLFVLLQMSNLLIFL